MPLDARPNLAHARSVLHDRFGHPDFRPGQDRIVSAVLDGRDALGILPTGGGKTVCYLVPALMLGGLTVVVSPLISLMADQVDRARAVGLRAAALNATLSPGERKALLTRCREGGLDLVLVSPERFEVAEFAAVLPHLPLRLVAVDEAHCISEWGHDFRPAYRRFGRAVEALTCPVLALTATATPRVRRDIVAVLGLRDPVRVVGSFDRPNLEWTVTVTGDHASKTEAIRRWVSRCEGSAIVYAATRRTVEAVRRDLAGLGLGAMAYHAGLEPEERSRVQHAFMEGGCRLVVATNAFGMGIDKPDVRVVVHYQLSSTLEAYYQEAGRAGRDGRRARCVALHGPDDLRLHRAFIDRSRPPVRRVRRVWRRVERAVRIAEGEGGEVSSTDLPRFRFSPPGSTTAAIGVLTRQGCLRGPVPDPASALPRTWSARPTARPPDLARVRALRAAALEKLAAVERYALTRGCRRAEILAYFGEAPRSEGCGRCDNCVRAAPGSGKWRQ